MYTLMWYLVFVLVVVVVELCQSKDQIKLIFFIKSNQYPFISINQVHAYKQKLRINYKLTNHKILRFFTQFKVFLHPYNVELVFRSFVCCSNCSCSQDSPCRSSWLEVAVYLRKGSCKRNRADENLG